MKKSYAIIIPAYFFGAALIFTVLSNSLGYDYIPIKKDRLYDYFERIEVLAFLWFMCLLGYSESVRDFNTIRNRLHVNHAMGFFRRSWWALAAIFLFKIKFTLIFPGAALFSLFFNHSLNKKRGLSWDYMSPESNHYDRLVERFYKVITKILGWIYWLIVPRFIKRKIRNKSFFYFGPGKFKILLSLIVVYWFVRHWINLY